MNIVLYVNSFLPVLGGREFVIHYLADALLRLGHDVRVLGPSGYWKNRHLRFRYPVHRWPTLRGFMSDQVAVSQLALDTALWGADVIHAHNTWPTGYRTVRLRRLRRYPLVITPHGQDIQSIPELGHGLRLDPVLNRKIGHAVANADLVTAISKNIELALIDAGAAPDRIRLIPNGVDIERYQRPGSIDIRKWLGVEPEARLIVTIGRYNPRKGQDYLVRAMPAILAREPRARLVVVGNKTEALTPLIRDLGLEGKVVLTGGISPSMRILNRDSAAAGGAATPDYLAELLGAGELYVSAGIQNNAEGLSLAVLEAMAAGLPVVATAISGNTDVVADGENGYLVKPADESALAEGIVRVLEQPAVHARMRAHARETASRYAWVQVAQRYLEVYQEAIELARRR
ncbi:MAG: glycosyltransferase family 4 protein [Gammaproteobacteria bacterium]|nr:glycosyltransferase family 4 protein [Gammaproteobacteria bacterium]